ncbi:MAG: transporter associated domain-containing protein [Pseudomonadales bacterium]|nr:transporter associated domain-containing protein [Pseudomonadales bacterium]
MTEGPSSQDSGNQSWIDKLKDVFSESVNDSKSLVEILRKAQKNAVLDADCLSIIEGALQVSDMQVREIMIPRSQVVTVEMSASPEEFLPTVIDAAHSRFPVVGESLDQVLGILLAKDLLPLILEKDVRKFNIKDVLRPAVFVPESKRLNVLLKEFRENRIHMAVVLDEYGCLSGVVTIEDVLEQIVGEIEDEHDVDEEDFIKPFDHNSHVVKALTPIEDFNEHFQTDFSEEDFDTIGGLVLQKFGHIPEREESVSIGNFVFKVLNADNRQIRLLLVSIPGSSNIISDTDPETDG